ncbi:MAG TPA: sugar phosphate isomerase/epimerase [Chloroflexia bacterium]|nr:sugar phosphate isomerase/epimerase [Chloroflexia bacterium]
MNLNQVAVQLYTLRDFLKTPSNIAESLKKVSEIGYKAVQLSGMGPIAEEELNEILEQTGLVCCATHEPGDLILNNPQAVVERLQKLRCKYTAYPFPRDVSLETAQEVANFAEALSRAGHILAEAGQVLTYHNHQLEFRRFGDKTVLELIFEKSDPRYLQAEIDTYWVQYGGGDPVAWCQRLQNRLPLLHMKDYVITSEYKPAFTEIGAGNLDFKRIVRAAEQAGCEWFIVEQDTCPGDPFDSLAKSLDYIKANLLNR